MVILECHLSNHLILSMLARWRWAWTASCRWQTWKDGPRDPQRKGKAKSNSRNELSRQLSQPEDRGRTFHPNRMITWFQPMRSAGQTPRRPVSVHVVDDSLWGPLPTGNSRSKKRRSWIWKQAKKCVAFF